jgi:SAM-dependent methyltransferase
MKCRHCGAAAEHIFLDLGFAPPSNAYLRADDLAKPERYYPLKLFVCETCWLVQTEDHARADELFSADYAYLSSTSSSWLEHSQRFAEDMIERLRLTAASHVIEVASNDGYLLRNFVTAGIPCLGIEPTASTAQLAEAQGIPVLREFFGERVGARLAGEGGGADLIIGNNVYAHVPDINDFTLGLKAVLKPGGCVTLEFPHVMRLIEQAQFDTVYHEHFSYLSLYTVGRIFRTAGLRVWDVEELPTHGGSLRVYGCHADDDRKDSPRVAELLSREARFGLQQVGPYRGFQSRADRVKNDFVEFLIQQKRAGRNVAAYGAAAKGNTLLNYGGVKPDLLSFVCDAAPAKQDKFMPGSHIPILHPDVLAQRKPDTVVILPWNIAEEVRKKLQFIRQWGGTFVTAVPKLEIT